MELVAKLFKLDVLLELFVQVGNNRDVAVKDAEGLEVAKSVKEDEENKLDVEFCVVKSVKVCEVLDKIIDGSIRSFVKHKKKIFN